MASKEQFKWINNEIDITPFYDKLSRSVKSLIEDAEQNDRDGLELSFYETCDAIEVHSKMLVPDILSKKEWNLICAKYSLPND